MTLNEDQGDGVAALTDNLLLERIRQGDTASFETLFYRHYDRVYGLLFRLVGSREEAEDLSQEAFLKLHRHAFSKRPLGRNPFKSEQEQNIGAWLYRVATNLGYDALRGRRRRQERDTILLPDPQGSPGAEKEVERREEQTAVRAGASEFLGLFRVQKFAPISISPEQIAILEQLAEEGMEPGELVIRNEPGAITPVDSLAEAGLRTGLNVRSLPGLGEPDEINVLDGGDGYLIVDLAAARAIVEAAGADPALLPESLDGARIDVAAFPGVQQIWGEDIIFMQAESPLVAYPDDIDPVILGEALLQVLGTEPREARRIANSVDWASTLLLPIPREMVTFSEVAVDGVTGVALKPLDSNGGALLWQKEGKVYMLNGQGSVEELLGLVVE